MVLKLWFTLATRWPFYGGKHFTAVMLSNYFRWLQTSGLATESNTEARRRNSTIWSYLSASCSRRLRPHHRGKTGSHVLGELVLFLWLLLTTLVDDTVCHYSSFIFVFWVEICAERLFWRSRLLYFRKAKMADRKVWSVTFKMPFNMSPKELKEAIDGAIESNGTVFQDLGNGEYLIEVLNQWDVEALVEEGFDFDDTQVSCHLSHGKLTNVSILNLRSYIEDDEIKKVLNQYGEVKVDVIRLRYKADRAFAGLENGNRLIKMVLEKRSIPYSLRIDGEWCRVIHNDQQPVCSECKELGHTRKRCREIICRICNEKGTCSIIAIEGTTVMRLSNRWVIKIKLRLIPKIPHQQRMCLSLRQPTM